jgi:hypothetical protein
MMPNHRIFHRQDAKSAKAKTMIFKTEPTSFLGALSVLAFQFSESNR